MVRRSRRDACRRRLPLHTNAAPSTGFSRVDRVLRDACGSQWTGAVARIERGGRVAFERAYGRTRADAAGEPVYVDTLFDLASLTKLFVATLALRAVERGALDLDGSLVRWFPKWADSEHAGITLRRLLSHDAGLNSGADYRLLLGERIACYAVERELVAAPGERVIYSDLGFIVVGELLQRAYGRSLSALLCDFAREGHRGVGYRPPAALHRAIPATEEDAWRGRVQGFVHDEKAYLMGGVAGHAGLFGSAADVAWLGEQYLGALRGRACMLSPSTVREALREQAFDPALRRGLGWALKTGDENSCGRRLAFESFGHTGFVGTSIWADPTRDVLGVLLTNSVYFGRRDTSALRVSFYESMADDLDLP